MGAGLSQADSAGGLDDHFDAAERSLNLDNLRLKALPKELLHYPAEQGKSVLRLNLSFNALPKLTGSLHTLFPNLVHLNLKANRLATLPVEFGLLVKLLFLDLGDNAFTEFPDPVASLPNLRVLILQGNKLKRMPARIGNLTHLQDLDLSGNRLQQLPIEITQLRQLETLSLQHNSELNYPPKHVWQSGLAAINEWFLSHEQHQHQHQQSGDSAALALPASSPSSYTRFESTLQSDRRESVQSFPSFASLQANSVDHRYQELHDDTAILLHDRDGGVHRESTSQREDRAGEHSSTYGESDGASNNSASKSADPNSLTDSTTAADVGKRDGGVGNGNQSAACSLLSEQVDAAKMVGRIREERAELDGLEALAYKDLEGLRRKQQLELVEEQKRRDQESFLQYQLDLEQRRREEHERRELAQQLEQDTHALHLESLRLRNENEWKIRKAREDEEKEQEDLRRLRTITQQYEAKELQARLHLEFKEREELANLCQLQRESERSRAAFLAAEEDRAQTAISVQNQRENQENMQRLWLRLMEQEHENRRLMIRARQEQSQQNLRQMELERERQNERIMETLSAQQKKILDTSELLMKSRIAEEQRWLDMVRGHQLRQEERQYLLQVNAENDEQNIRAILKNREFQKEQGRFMDELAAKAAKEEMRKQNAAYFRKLENERATAELAWVSEYQRILRAKPRWMKLDEAQDILLEEMNIKLEQPRIVVEQPTFTQNEFESTSSKEDPKDAVDEDQGNSSKLSECAICMERSINTVILECGHACVCDGCGASLSACPICRGKITRIVKVFFQ